MIPLPRLYVLDLERCEVEVVHAEERDGVLDVEAEGEGLDEVGALLDRADVFCVFGGLRGGGGRMREKGSRGSGGSGEEKGERGGEKGGERGEERW